MRVKLLAIMAGPGGAHDAGSIIEVNDEIARMLIEGGYATPIDAVPIEAAVNASPAEHATMPHVRRRGA